MPLLCPTRRDFVRQTFDFSAGFVPHSWSSGRAPQEMPQRQLGRTGRRVSILGLGGYHVGLFFSDREAITFVRTAIDLGVTFLDNAWEYHHGRSEEIYGKALADGYRDRVFLMTNHHGRADKRTALRQLDDSLRRLRTDHLDLWQFHEIIYDDDPEAIFSFDGAIEAAIEAKQSGKVRHIGFTGRGVWRKEEWSGCARKEEVRKSNEQTSRTGQKRAKTAPAGTDDLKCLSFRMMPEMGGKVNKGMYSETC